MIEKMKKIYTFAMLTLMPLMMMGQGWPSGFSGVMLQGFYWDSYNDSKWTVLEAQADEFAEFFKLVWIPQSANCGGTSMGYDDLYWFTNYNSSFGSKTQLQSMINTFKSKGIGTIADVVLNHRRNVSNWVDFPAENYNGVTYQLKSTDICRDDDNGATLSWANTNGYSLSSNNDTGEGWGGLRDLDHTSTNVQTNVKAYVKMLLDDLGYAGFRYDMVRGYAAQYTGMYNAYAAPTYSVGEYWDGNVNAVKAWVNGTKVNNVILRRESRYGVPQCQLSTGSHHSECRGCQCLSARDAWHALHLPQAVERIQGEHQADDLCPSVGWYHQHQFDSSTGLQQRPELLCSAHHGNAWRLDHRSGQHQLHNSQRLRRRDEWHQLPHGFEQEHRDRLG